MVVFKIERFNKDTNRTEEFGGPMYGSRPLAEMVATELNRAERGGSVIYGATPVPVLLHSDVVVGRTASDIMHEYYETDSEQPAESFEV